MEIRTGETKANSNLLSLEIRKDKEGKEYFFVNEKTLGGEIIWEIEKVDYCTAVQEFNKHTTSKPVTKEDLAHTIRLDPDYKLKKPKGIRSLSWDWNKQVKPKKQVGEEDD